MLFQWACSGTPGGDRCFLDHMFLDSCHLLGTLSPNCLGSLTGYRKLFNKIICYAKYNLLKHYHFYLRKGGKCDILCMLMYFVVLTVKMIIQPTFLTLAIKGVNP